MSRYETMFEQLRARNEGAFVPFVTLGDPDQALSLRVIDTLIEAGADALELGIPFSDPLADGPTLQDAAQRALKRGTTPVSALDLVARVRERHPDVPIGLLVYANLVFGPGIDRFYGDCAEAGVDSVLIADVPVEEADPFLAAATTHGVDPVLICPPNCSDEVLRKIAAHGRGYTYLLSRAGVTGAERAAGEPPRELLEKLHTLKAAPPILGFGISAPDHVSRAMDYGVAGAISGSAVVKLMAEHMADPETMLAELRRFAGAMKAATRG